MENERLTGETRPFFSRRGDDGLRPKELTIVKCQVVEKELDPEWIF